MSLQLSYMKTYLLKLRVILPVFLTITFSTVFGLALVRWLFAIQVELLNFKEEVWHLWLPLIFPWIPITLWLRQKLRILSFKDNDRGRLFFQVIAWGTMVAATMVTQSYLTTATGKLATLASVDELADHKARYYQISSFQVATSLGGSYTDFRTSGKSNNRLHFDVYFVFPIVKDASLQPVGSPLYWYGIKYSEQVSNRLDDAEKEQRYQTFYDQCVAKINKYDFHAQKHFIRTPNSDKRDNYLQAVRSRMQQPITDEIIVLEPEKVPFESRNGNKLAWIFGSMGIGFVIMLFSLIWPRYSRYEHLKLQKGVKPKQDDVVDMFKYLIPKGDHFATSVILDLNIAVFVGMALSGVHIISPNGLELLEWGANRRSEVVSGEWWRLLTSMFLHGGIMHLFLNIYGLVIAAMFLEPVLGRKNYFILYVLSGLAGSLASIWWYESVISVGASGAIFGLYGAILALLLTNSALKKGNRFMLPMIGLYVIINLLFGLTGGIDNAAHIGGLLSGAGLVGLLYKRQNA